MNRKWICRLAFLVLAFAWFIPTPGLFAGDDENVAYLSRGFSRVLKAPFQIPYHLIQKTVSEPIVLGTLDGALTGTYYAIQDLSTGAFDIVRGVIPYAKYLIFFI